MGAYTICGLEPVLRQSSLTAGNLRSRQRNRPWPRLYRALQTALGPEQAQKALYDGLSANPTRSMLHGLSRKGSNLPVFVDVARVEVFPTDQATGGGSMVKFEQ